MANTKISALPAASSADAADLTIAVNASSDEKATITQVATFSRAVASAATISAIVGSGSSLTINNALADSDTRIAGTTSANLFFADAGLDKVGIATAVPTQKLDVTGTVNATLFSGSGSGLTGVGATATAFRTVATDPSPLVAGDVWYNSTSTTFKSVILVGAWSAGGALPTYPIRSSASGTATAGLRMSGQSSVLVYAYNGTTWSATTSVSTTRQQAAASGTSTSTLITGGTASGGLATVEAFNGTTWTAGTSMPSYRYNHACAGASATSILVAGGSATGSSSSAYNGTTWTAGGTLTVSRTTALGCGTATACFVTGGGTPSGYPGEVYNGTTWTANYALPLYRANGAAFGTTTSLIYSGGQNAPGTVQAGVYQHNGSAWSAVASLSTARYYQSGIGAGPTGLVAGGYNSALAAIDSTENWAGAVTAKTFTVA